MKTRSKIIIALLVLGISSFAGYKLINKSDSASKNTGTTPIAQAVPQPAKATFKTFTGQEFSDLYNSFVYPNTQKINEDSPITGNEVADKRIKQLAETKGYRLRSAPVADTFREVQKDMRLQERAAQPWVDLVTVAKKDNISLSLSAAYRSAEDQRTIFLDKIRSIPAQSIAEGKADGEINKILERTAVPGFSRHHTGYTVDIQCDNGSKVIFKMSSCYQWLSQNNYLHAKEHGWIPSYPDGAGQQGPEPESWEFVWVGRDSVMQ